MIPQKIKDLFIKLLRSNSSTAEVADGLAIGMFIAMLPIMGIQMYVALVLTRLFRKNTLVAMLAAWVTNPLTSVPIYLFNLWVGNFLYREPMSIMEVYQVFKSLNLHNVLNAGKDILIPLWIGSVIVGLVAAFIAQRLCLRYYDTIRARFYHLIHHVKVEKPKKIK